MSTTTSSLLFDAPRSSIEIGFWEELYNRKLDSLKLDSGRLSLSAELTLGDSQAMLITKNSFSKVQPCEGVSSERIAGSLWNVNTIEVSCYLLIGCVLISIAIVTVVYHSH